MGGFYITENFKTYEFVVGPQEFDEEIFSYEMRVNCRKDMFLPGVSHTDDSYIELKNINIDGKDIRDSLKLINEDENKDIKNIPQLPSSIKIYEDRYELNIPITPSAEKVSFEAKSKFGIHMAHVYLIFQTRILPLFYDTEAVNKTHNASLKSAIAAENLNINSFEELNQKPMPTSADGNNRYGKYISLLKQISQIDYQNYQRGNTEEKKRLI